MSDLYGKDEKLGKDKVEGDTSLDAGSYSGVIGRTYREKNAKTFRTSVITDIFCVNRSNESGSVSIDIMRVTLHEGKQHLNFRMTEKGPITYGIIFRMFMRDVVDTDSEGAKSFFAGTRKRFAKALGAFDDATSTVDWSKIQALAGRFISFNLVESKGYTNLDPKSINLYDAAQNVSQENLKKIYEVIEVERSKRASASKPVETSAALPEEIVGEVASQQTNQNSPSNDDLPF